MAGLEEDRDLEDQGSGDTTLGKRPRDEAASDNFMDCSHPTNWCAAKRQEISAHCQGALLCLPLQLGSSHMAPQKLARELARCLHESKYMLVKDVVNVLGPERSIELFTKTAETQEQGGILCADGNTKRAPGGVFFSLVKSSTTDEEKKHIFMKEKSIKRTKNAKERARKKRKKKREEEKERNRQIQEDAQRELEVFRQDLGLGGEERPHPPDRNMERRWRKREGYSDLDNPVDPEDSGELNEGWRNEFDDDGDCDDFSFQLSEYQQLRRKEVRSKEKENHCDAEAKSSLLEENVAADQFEQTDVCDVGIDIACDF